MLRIENQNQYKDHPILPRNDYKYADGNQDPQPQPKNNPNPVDVTTGILDRIRELTGQGHAIVDAISGNSQVNFGDNITVTPYEPTSNKDKILGMPKSLAIAGGVTLLIIGGVVVFSIVNKNKTKKLSAHVNV